MLMRIAAAACLLPAVLLASRDSGLPATVKVVNVSSCYSSTYCPQDREALSNVALFLGDGASKWWMSKAGDSSPQWLVIEFNLTCQVTGLRLGNDGACSDPNGAMPKSLTLQTWQQSVWTDETSFINTINWGGQHHTGFNFTAQMVRLWISDWYTDGCYNGRMALRALDFDLQDCAPLCAEGDYRQGGQCVPCPQGFGSLGGVTTECNPLLSTALNSTFEPQVRLVGGRAGSTHITVSFEELPKQIHNGWQLSYIADIAPKLEDSSPESNCSMHESWHRSETTLAASFSFRDFDDPCQLNLTVEENSITRTGLLVVSLMLTSPGPEEKSSIISQWVYPMQVVYDTALRVMQQLTGIWEPIWHPSKPPVHPGAFESKLEFFETHLFRSIKDPLIYHDGEKAWIMHSLIAEKFPMAVKWVLLSRSADPQDALAIVHNLTDSVEEIAHSSGRLEFSVRLRTCKDCRIHIWSEIDLARSEPGARRLLDDASTHYAYQVLRIVVWDEGDTDSFDAQEEEEEEGVPLILSLEIAVPSAFMLSVLLGVLLHCAIPRASGQKRTYILVEFLDVCLDVVAFILCQAEGDLQLQDNGWIARLLILSNVMSVGLFVVELALALLKPKVMDDHLSLFVTIHVIGEDTFQMLLYGLVQASQASTSSDNSAVLWCAVLQAFIFIIVKILSVVDPCKGSIEKSPRSDYGPVPRSLGAPADD